MIRPFRDAWPKLDESNYIAPSAEIIGDVTLGKDSSIWFNATIRGDVNWIRIGEASNVQDNAVVHVSRRTAPTQIGNKVTIGHSAVIHGCEIRDRVLVGIGAVILDHAVISEDCIIGARTLVTQRMRIPPGTLVLGSPARVVRDLNDAERASILLHSDNYVKYGAIYRGTDVPDFP